MRRSSILLLSILVCLALSIPLYAQEPQVDRQIIVFFSEDALVFPQGVSRTVPDRLDPSSSLHDLFAELYVEEIEQGLPTFTRADTLRILQDGTEYRTLDWTNLFVLTLSTDADIEEALKRLLNEPYVIFAEKNQRISVRSPYNRVNRIENRNLAVSASTLNERKNTKPPNNRPESIWGGMVIPNDPHFARQWALKNDGTTGQGGGTPGADIKAWKAWDVTTGNSTVKIGIVDTGVYGSHEDLTGRVSGSTTDIGDHGTAVAAVAAAKGNNNKGIAGVNWNASIHSQSYGTFPTATTVADAIDAAVESGAKVLNNSWGYANSSSLIFSFLYSAYQADVVLVHSNPEDHPDNNPNVESDFPNNIGPWIINVGAMTNQNLKSGFSFSRSDTDIGAPGGGGLIGPLEGNIFSASSNFSSMWNGYYRYYAGTSYAAPHVTGTAALMLTVNPSLYAFDIEQIIKRTGPLWPACDANVGCGMLNAENAVKRVIAPYTVTHGNAAFNKISTNATWTFTASPVTGVAAGQYKVDRYELKMLANHQYSQTPWAWMGPPEKGLSAANPNNAAPYLQELITPTSQSITTYFYFIRTVLASGATVNKWAPFDPTVYKRGGVYKYTVLEHRYL